MRTERTIATNPYKSAYKNCSVKIKNPERNQVDELLTGLEVSVEPLDDYIRHDNISGADNFRIIKRKFKVDSEGIITPSNEIVNIVKSKYNELSNKSVFNDITDSLDRNSIDFSIPVLFLDQKNGSSKFGATIALEGISQNIDGSLIKPTIDIYNANDGTSSAKVLFGAYRMKCSNGMLIGDEYMFEKMYHTKSIKDIAFGDAIEMAMQKFETLMQSIEQMQSVKFNNVMLETLQALHFDSTFCKKYFEIQERYMLENEEIVSKDSLWYLYATATNYISNYIKLKSFDMAIKQHKILNYAMNQMLAA